MRRVATVSVLAWLAGLVTYEGWLRLVWHQSVGEDWMPVALWSACAFTVAVPLIYLPSMFLVRKRVGGYVPVGWFVLVAIAVGVIPTGVIVFANGGDMAAMASPEAITFYVMFAFVGLVFGTGYAWKRAA